MGGGIAMTQTWGRPSFFVVCRAPYLKMVHFWGPAGTTTPIEKITVDLRPGGVFETVMTSDDGGEYTMRAVYLRVDRPARLIAAPGRELIARDIDMIMERACPVIADWDGDRPLLGVRECGRERGRRDCDARLIRLQCDIRQIDSAGNVDRALRWQEGARLRD